MVIGGIIAGIILVSLCGMLCFLWRAPLGYEDKSGFHLGPPPPHPANDRTEAEEPKPECGQEPDLTKEA